MRWRGLERSSNVDDRRSNAVIVAGAAAVLASVVAVLLTFVVGKDIGALDRLVRPESITTNTLTVEAIERGQFVQAVLGTTETYWTAVFADAGLTYREPQLILFSNLTESACGDATTAIGPHYCPLDETIYIDLVFFDEVGDSLGVHGDFAQAYVIAHEVGHHVQEIEGLIEQVDALVHRGGDAAGLSMKMELQADCLAGSWAYSVYQRGDVLEPGDIDGGLRAAAAFGDDRIQRRTQGQVTPETWTHGSSEQRVRWFATGYESGSPAACNTFAK